MIFIPLLAWMGAELGPTVYSRKGFPSRSGTLTFSKTSHGPQKSMMTAPSEMTKATGILPCAGGFKGFASTGVKPARLGKMRGTEKALTRPNIVVLWSSSLRFIGDPLFHHSFVGVLFFSARY